MGSTQTTPPHNAHRLVSVLNASFTVKCGTSDNHRRPLALQFIHLASLSNLKTRKLICVKTGSYRILIALAEDKVYAVDDMCTHEDASLSKGSLHGDCVKCPLHGSRFRLGTGEALDEPAEEALKTYPVKVEGDDILVAIPE